MEAVENIECILSQWQTCVEMANSISQRRDTMNNLFVTLNLAVFAAISLIWDIKTVILSVAGIVVCAVWLLFIRNFRVLNAAKFDVINQLEQQLPVQAFQEEWKLVKNNTKYTEGTILERIFPFAFGAIYLGVLIAVFVSHFA